MPLETMRLFFALLALAANVAFLGGVGVLIAARTSPGAAALRDRMRDAVRGYELWMAAAVALVATLGSLYFSEIAHFEPCKYCWFQRIAMYPLVPVLGIAAWRRDHTTRIDGFVLAGAGAALSAYHYLIQHFPNLSGNACSVTVPCTAAYVWEFNFVSIPYMALSGFTLILLLLGLAASDKRTDAPSSEEVRAA